MQRLLVFFSYYIKCKELEKRHAMCENQISEVQGCLNGVERKLKVALLKVNFPQVPEISPTETHFFGLRHLFQEPHIGL